MLLQKLQDDLFVALSEPPVRQFVAMIVYQLNEWPNFLESRTFSDLICLSIPFDKARVRQFREMRMGHLDFELLHILVFYRDVCWDLRVPVVLWIMFEQGTE